MPDQHSVIMVKKIKQQLFTPLVWLAALVFLFEELIRDSTARFMASLSTLRAIASLDNWPAYLQLKRALSSARIMFKDKGRLLRFLRHIRRLRQSQ